MKLIILFFLLLFLSNCNTVKTKTDEIVKKENDKLSQFIGQPVSTLIAGDKQVEFRDDFNSDGFIFVKQDQPLPLSVLAIYPTLVTSDG